MFRLLVEKELKAFIQSPKFVATFAACTILILLSIYAGIMEYQAGRAQFESATALVSQELTEATSWNQVGGRQRIFREPKPLQIFASGIHFDIGRYSLVSSWQDIKLQQSYYSIDPIFAVFRALDFVFIVMVVLSLITIVYAYDIVSGEKEDGTLRLLMANSVPRVTLISAKLTGAWLGLMVPLLIPLSVGILLVMLFQIPLTGSDWLHLAALGGFSILYLTAFLCIGALCSTLTHRSEASFLMLLIIWIVVVLMVPRGGMMVASQIHPIPTVSELDSRKEGYARDRREVYFEWMSEHFQERRQAMEGMSEDERNSYEQNNEWDWMLEEDEQRQAMEADIAENNRKIDEEAVNTRQVQERLGFALSRLSPASAYQLAAMDLSETDLALKLRYSQALQSYRTVFQDYIKERNPAGGMMRFSSSREAAAPLELSDMPQFEPATVASTSRISFLDMLLLSLFAFVSIAGCLAVFNRYDVR